MGKKLTRKSVKLRAISLNKQRKEHLAQADALLVKWGLLHKEKNGSLSPHTLPSTTTWDEVDLTVASEDQITDEMLQGMATEQRLIAEMYWSDYLKPAEIADRQGLPKEQIRALIGFIREQVVNKALN